MSREVEWIAGELFRARVRSRSSPSKRHMVDLEALKWNGDCDCIDMQTNRRRAIKRKGLCHPATRCWHIEAARAAWLDEWGPVVAWLLDHPKHGQLVRLMMELGKLKAKDRKEYVGP